MSDPAPLAYGRDAHGRFTNGNRLGHGRTHAFAQKSASLRKAFFDEVTPADMRALVRKLITEATGGNLQAARLVLLWIVGKPGDAVHPDGIAAMLAAEAQAAVPPPPLPADPEDRMNLAVMDLAKEIRTLRGGLTNPSEAVKTTWEGLDTPG
jgi:hypothetical protein